MTSERKLLPMTKGNGCSKYAGLNYYSPRTYDPNRPYLRLTDVTHPAITSNKKPAVEVAINRPNFLQGSVYPFDKVSNFQSIPGQVKGGLVSRPSPFSHMADVPSGTSGTSTGRKDFKDAILGDASVKSHNVRKILKKKINHILDSENVMSEPIRNSFRKANDGRLLRSVGCKEHYGSFSSLGRPCQIKDGNSTLTDVIHNEGVDLQLTLGRNYEVKTNTCASGKADGGPMKDASRKAIDYNKAFVDYQNYAHLAGATSQTDTVGSNTYQNNTLGHVIHNGECSARRTLGCSNKEKENVMFPGGFRFHANNKVSIENQNSVQSSRPNSWVGTIEQNAYPAPCSNSNPKVDAKKKNLRKRKKPETANESYPDLYPLSIFSLLSTGIFDGTPVKYASRRRGVILHGVIKGRKILCSCKTCNNSECISPYKFEFHAGGKSKRPHRQIYFENGKTLHKVLQELLDTPEDMLSNAIQKIVNSVVRSHVIAR